MIIDQLPLIDQVQDADELAIERGTITYKTRVSDMAAADAPLMDGTAAVGTSPRFARADHVHPSDTHLFDMIYPVGSIYMSVNSVNPGTLFGGTWQQIKDRFLLSAGDSYAAGGTGGAATVSLSVGNLPSHDHSIPALSGTATSKGAHQHDANEWLYAISSNAYSHNMNGPPIYVNSTPCGNIHDLKANGWANPNYYTSSAGAHTHPVTTTESTTGTKGSGTAHNNMPPYLTVYVWKRTA